MGRCRGDRRLACFAPKQSFDLRAGRPRHRRPVRVAAFAAGCKRSTIEREGFCSLRLNADRHRWAIRRGGVNHRLPEIASRGVGEREFNLLPMRVDEKQQGVPLDWVSLLIHIVKHVASESHPEALREIRSPLIVAHLRAAWLKEANIFDVVPAYRATEEELSALKGRLFGPDARALSSEIKESFLAIVKLPVRPGNFIILAECVVIPVLGMAELIAAIDHRYTLREKEGREEIPLLSLAHTIDAAVARRSFRAAIP